MSRTQDVENLDRAATFPLRGPLFLLLVLFSLMVGMAASIPARASVALIMGLCGIWLLICGAVVRLLPLRSEVIEWKDLFDSQAGCEALLLGLVTFIALSPAFVVTWLAPSCTNESEEGVRLGGALLCILGAMCALAVSVGIWLPAVALLFGKRTKLVNLLRIDQHLSFWTRAGGGSIKYWAISFGYLVVAGSVWDLEIFYWWPSLQGMRPFLSAIAFGYWSLMSIRLAYFLRGDYSRLVVRSESR